METAQDEGAAPAAEPTETATTETAEGAPVANNEENTSPVNDSAATAKNNDGIDPANDEAALQEQINKQRQEALANDLEAKLQETLASGGGGSSLAEGSKNDAGQQTLGQQQSIPVPPLHSSVLVRLTSDGRPALGIVTNFCEGRGRVNVTVFPDGETPRPIGNVPHASVAEGSPYWDLA